MDAESDGNLSTKKNKLQKEKVDKEKNDKAEQINKSTKKSEEDSKEEDSKEKEAFSDEDEFNPSLAAMEEEIKPKVIITINVLQKNYSKLIVSWCYIK